MSAPRLFGGRKKRSAEQIRRAEVCGTRFLDHVAGRWLAGQNRYGIPMTTIFHTSHPGLAAALRRNRRWFFHAGRLLGESGVSSWETMAATRARRGENRGGSKFAGHMRAVQAFRFVGDQP